ncbi:MAG: cupin domain-containing protein [Gemmatimonadota bacterium]
MKHVTILTMAALLSVTAAARAQEMAGGHEEHTAPDHLAIAAEEIQWSPAPPALPAGAEIAVLEGDPAKEGPFTIRLRLPAGYKVAPHRHHGIEHLTILSGRAGIGLGETWDGEIIRYAGPGGFFVMQPGVAHFAMIEEDSIVQVHSTGPWVLEYVNPADDPRRSASSSTSD